MTFNRQRAHPEYPWLLKALRGYRMRGPYHVSRGRIGAQPREGRRNRRIAGAMTAYRLLPTRRFYQWIIRYNKRHPK